MPLDMEIGFISAIAAKSSTQAFHESGISSDMMKNAACRAAMSFIEDYVGKYKAIPPTKLTEEHSMLDLSINENADVGYWVEEIRNRELYDVIRGGMSDVSMSMSGKNATGALERLEVLIKDARKSNMQRSRVMKLFDLNDEVIKFYEQIKRHEFGIVTPWNTMNSATLGWQPGDMCVFAGRLKVGKSESHLSVLTDFITGEVKTLKEIVEEKRSTYKWKKGVGVIGCTPDAWLYSGVKKGYEVKLDNGQDIIVSEDHPLLSPDGDEVKMADGSLRVGDYVGVVTGYEWHKCPKSIDDNILVVNALMTSDGGLTGWHPSYSKKCQVLLKIMEKSLSVNGYVFTSVNKECSRTIGTESKKWADVEEFSDYYELDMVKSKEKKVPKFVYRLPKVQLARWIGLFYSSDGDVPNSKGADVTLASKDLIYGIRHLLLRFGVYSTVKYKKAKCEGKEFDAWRLSIRGRYLDRFLDEIPLYGSKFEGWTKEQCQSDKENDWIPVTQRMKERIHEIVTEGKKNDKWMYQVGHKLGVPDKFRARVSTWTTQDGVNHEVSTERICRADGFSESKLYTLSKDGLQLNRFKAFCEVYGCESEFAWMWTGIDWAKMESITDVGDHPMYDLSLDEDHWFIANDMVTHNTWVVLNLAKAAWKQGKSVLLISAEMSQRSLSMRFHSLDMEMSYGRLRKARLSSTEETEFYEAMKTSKEKPNPPYIFGEDFRLSINEVEAAIDELRPHIVFIDGMYLMSVPGVPDRFDKAPIIADETKMMAKKYGIPIIGTMQLNRSAAGKKESEVDASMLGLSDAFAWNSDYVFGMIRSKEMREAKEMLIKTLAIREGDDFDMVLNWDFERMDFSEKNVEDSGEGFKEKVETNYGKGNTHLPFKDNTEDDFKPVDEVPF